MAKKTGKIRSAQIYASLEKRSFTGLPPTCDGSSSAEDIPLDLVDLARQPIRSIPDTSKTLRMKKFRTQLLHHWLVNTFTPCSVGDVGGGKGLLSYLLNQDGWDASVIDPIDQTLPDKYKDIHSEQRVKIPPNASVRRTTACFEVEMGQNLDLLIGMHAHGCNALIIDACSRYGSGFILFPCCVIDEPFFPRLGVHWIECLADYATSKEMEIFPFRLNFKGQNIGICHPGKASLRRL